MSEKKSLFPTRNHRTATCLLAVVLIAVALYYWSIANPF